MPPEFVRKKSPVSTGLKSSTFFSTMITKTHKQTNKPKQSEQSFRGYKCSYTAKAIFSSHKRKNDVQIGEEAVLPMQDLFLLDGVK